MRKSIWAFAALFAAFALSAVSCQQTKRGEYAAGAGTIFCDDGFKAILDEEIEVFEYSYPEASIIPCYVSEVEAIDTLLCDGTQSIIVTKELTKDQIQYIKDKHKHIVRQKCIAVDAVALITNKDNPVKELSVQEIGSILKGEITRWSEVMGNDTTRIKLVFDNNGSSTVSYLRNKFLPKGQNISDHAYATAAKTNADVFDYIKKDKDAIGVISVSWLGEDLSAARKVPMDKRMADYSVQGDTIATELTSEVNIIKVSNPCEDNDFSTVSYKPYQAYIASGEYPLFRKVYMISTAPNSTVMHSFFAFMTGPVGQKIMLRTGILPYNMGQRIINLIEK